MDLHRFRLLALPGPSGSHSRTNVPWPAAVSILNSPPRAAAAFPHSEDAEARGERRSLVKPTPSSLNLDQQAGGGLCDANTYVGGSASVSRNCAHAS